MAASCVPSSSSLSTSLSMCSLIGVGRSARPGGRPSRPPPVAPPGPELSLAQLERSPGGATAPQWAGGGGGDDPLSVKPGGGVFIAVKEKSMSASWSGVLGGGIRVKSVKGER